MDNLKKTERKMIEKTALLVWNSCLEIIKDNVSQQSFKTWFEPIKPVDLKGNALTIQVPSQFFYEWIEEHYVALLRKTIKRELGADAKLEYKVVVDNNTGNGKSSTVNYPNYNTGNNENPDVSFPLFLQGNSIKNPFIIPGLKTVSYTHLDVYKRQDEILMECDETIAIPMFGENSSMNVACSLSVCLYEIQKQKSKK